MNSVAYRFGALLGIPLLATVLAAIWIDTEHYWELPILVAVAHAALCSRREDDTHWFVGWSASMYVLATTIGLFVIGSGGDPLFWIFPMVVARYGIFSAAAVAATLIAKRRISTGHWTEPRKPQVH